MGLPGYTCPDLDKIAKAIRRHVPEPERYALLAKIEELRRSHVLLRAAAKGRPEPVREVEGIDEKIQKLLARYERKKGVT